MDDSYCVAFRIYQSAYDKLSNCQLIWDLTSANTVDQV